MASAAHVELQDDVSRKDTTESAITACMTIRQGFHMKNRIRLEQCLQRGQRHPKMSPLLAPTETMRGFCQRPISMLDIAVDEQQAQIDRSNKLKQNRVEGSNNRGSSSHDR
jgi:hypothetical protein